jgi:hypothetical protein
MQCVAVVRYVSCFHSYVVSCLAISPPSRSTWPLVLSRSTWPHKAMRFCLPLQKAHIYTHTHIMLQQCTRRAHAEHTQSTRVNKQAHHLFTAPSLCTRCRSLYSSSTHCTRRSLHSSFTQSPAACAFASGAAKTYHTQSSSPTRHISRSYHPTAIQSHTTDTHPLTRIPRTHTTHGADLFWFGAVWTRTPYCLRAQYLWNPVWTPMDRLWTLDGPTMDPL